DKRHRVAVGQAVDQELHGTVRGRVVAGGDGGPEGGRLPVADGSRIRRDHRGRRHRSDGEGGAAFIGRQGGDIAVVASVFCRDRVAASRLGDRQLRRAIGKRYRVAVGHTVDQEL